MKTCARKHISRKGYITKHGEHCIYHIYIYISVNLIFSTAIVPSTVISPIKTLICDTKAVQIHQVDYITHHDTFVLLLH